MKCTILGTRGEIPESAPYHSRQSGVLVDDTLLIDIGEAEFLDHEPENIIITHLHPDHACFVRRGESIETDIPMYAPEEFDGRGAVVKSFGSRRRFSGITVRAIPTIHSLKVKSQAYVLVRKGTRLLYSGDLVWIEKKHHDTIGRLDAVITEASFIRKGGMIRRDKKSGRVFGHAGLPRLVELFSRFTNRIILVHFGSWFYKDSAAARKKVRALAREHNVTIEVGYDNLELTV